MFRVLLHEPRIPGNTGNIVRLTAVTGCELHLVEPLGYDLNDAKLRRAGLDYHDFASVSIHADIDAAWAALAPARVFAFTTKATRRFTDVAYETGDVLLFGSEPTGLPPEVLTDQHVSDQVLLPMLPARRSLNLSNVVAVAVYEAWRQHDFAV